MKYQYNILMKKIFSIFALMFVVIVTTGAGYVGTLPDIDAEFSYMKKKTPEKAQAPFSVKELDEKTQQSLKPIPREDDSYIDIIVKKDKTTKYLKDVNGVIIVLEKLRRCLNTNQDIQMFNAIVSNFIDNVEYIRVEYKDKPESNYLSYNRLLVISQHSREVANFRTQGYATQKYMPYTSDKNIYTKEALEAKLETLLNEVNETIFILKNLE